MSYSNKTTKTPTRAQQGFTLIEIIAVLVILGILAAVAVPRYYDMQEEARNAAVEGALASCVGNLNMKFAKHLASGNETDTIISTITSDDVDIGDFECSYTEASGVDGNVTVELSEGPTWYDEYTGTNNSTNVILYE